MARTRRYIINQPTLIRKLADVSLTIEGTEDAEDAEDIPEEERMTLADKRAMITDIFQQVKRGGSRRQTRKKACLKKTRKLKK